jgi:hypothetical protein
MRRAVLFFAVLALVAAFTSAPSIAQEKSQTTQNVVSVTGTWEGELVYQVWSSRIILQLNQDGEKVEGSYALPQSSLRTTAAVVGTLKGNQLSLTIPSIAFGWINATVDGNTMTGTYVGKTGRHNNLTATRVK